MVKVEKLIPRKGVLMKLFKKLSLLLVLAMLLGAIGAAAPKQVEAQTPTKFSVLEFVSSDT
mgnify:FL=1|jgi:hypothetical protein